MKKFVCIAYNAEGKAVYADNFYDEVNVGRYFYHQARRNVPAGKDSIKTLSINGRLYHL